jgi:hypothetical protein
MSTSGPHYQQQPPWPYHANGADLQGVILGRLLAGQDRQIELLQRIEGHLSKEKPKMNWMDFLMAVRQTAWSLVPIGVLALIILGKLTVLEGFGIIRQAIPGMGGE